MATEVREKYYEVYLDGTLYHEGSFESCKNMRYMPLTTIVPRCMK